MKKISVKISVMLIAVVLAGAAIVFTQRVQNNTSDKMPIKSIPELEAERLSRETFSRTDTGRLTPEALAQEREAISTRSNLFVIEGVKASSVSLPITGERAKIAFFSPTDGSLDIQLTDPNGSEIRLAPHTRNESVEPDAFSKVVPGRGKDGVLLLSDQNQTTPGTYIANVRQSKSPIDIIVNDEGGPELNIWLSESGLDSSHPITLYAKLVDGENSISGAELNTKVRGTTGKGLQLAETEPGVYSATINPSKLSGIATFIVEAKGNTARGLQFLRHGSIDLVTGQSYAKLVGIGGEKLTETDLVVEVNVQVTSAGRYYARGNLLGANDEPIAWAQDASELTPGRHTLTLRFARELINQSGQSAGFKLSNVELMNTTNMPGVKAPNKINDYFLKNSL